METRVINGFEWKKVLAKNWTEWHCKFSPVNWGNGGPINNVAVLSCDQPKDHKTPGAGHIWTLKIGDELVQLKSDTCSTALREASELLISRK